MLEINGISKSFRDNEVFKDVNFTLKQQEIVALIGKSGCGKTTLSHCIMGFTSIDSGSISFQEKRIDHLNIKTKKREVFPKIQMILQNSQNALHPQKKVITILEETVRSMSRMTSTDDFHSFEECMQIVGLNPGYLHKKTCEMSGGELQRLCIARALMIKPELILADEPFSSIDSILKFGIFTILRKSIKRRGSLLLITHDLEFSMQHCDRILLIDGTRLINYDDLTDKEYLYEEIKRRLV